jgi:hypothetical protein
VLIDGEVFESFYRFFGRPLCLQVDLQDVDVIIGLLETVALDGFDALEQLAAAIEDRLGRSERIGGLGWRLTLDEVRVSTRTRNHSRLIPGRWRSASSPPKWTFEISSTVPDPPFLMTLSPTWGNDWLLWCGGFLAWLGRDSASVALLGSLHFKSCIFASSLRAWLAMDAINLFRYTLFLTSLHESQLSRCLTIMS